MSWAKAGSSRSSTIAVPPNVITTTAPANRSSQGRAWMSTSAFWSGSRSVAVLILAAAVLVLAAAVLVLAAAVLVLAAAVLVLAAAVLVLGAVGSMWFMW